MIELKRDIGDGLSVHWSEASNRFVFRDGDEFLFWLSEEQFKNLDGFHSYVQTELASRQALEPLPEHVRGAWLNEKLVWIFERNQELKLVTDEALKLFLNTQNLPMHDRPNDGVIRKIHTDLYASSVLKWKWQSLEPLPALKPITTQLAPAPAPISDRLKDAFESSPD